MAYRQVMKQDVSGKTLVLRVDLNSNVVEGKVTVSAKLREHSKSVKKLLEKKAKLVVLSHQGREGEPDFVSLKQHAKVLSEETGYEIPFCTWEENYIEKISNLKDGEALLLENTRFQKDESLELTPEEHSKSKWISAIAGQADMFVQDALSVCHRPHASVVGFAPLLPCFAGPVLAEELEALGKMKKVKDKKVLVLGGAKPKDSIKIMKSVLEQKGAGRVLAGGLFGELLLKANGISLGKKDAFFKEKGLEELIPKAKEVLEKRGSAILMPLDVAVDTGNGRAEIAVEKLPSQYGTCDIGAKTTAAFAKEIAAAKLIVMNGPMGKYESKEFAKGTKEILAAISRSKAFSLLGGGDTETSIEQLGFSHSDFSHVSLAGKALLSYLAGEDMPGLKILH